MALTPDQLTAVLVATTVVNTIGIVLCAVSLAFQIKSWYNGKLLGLNAQLILLLLIGEFTFESIQILSNWMADPGFWCTFSAWGYISTGNVTIMIVCAVALNLIVALLKQSQISGLLGVYAMLTLPASAGLIFGSLPLIVDGYGINDSLGSCYYTDDAYSSFWPWISYNIWVILAIAVGFSSAACVTYYVKGLQKKSSEDKSLNSLTTTVIVRTMYYPAVLTFTQIPSILQNAYPDSGFLVALSYLAPAIQGVLHAIIYLTSPTFKRDHSRTKSALSSSQTISAPVIVSIS
ncbi:hypothetical protein HDV01_000458 [Terramyces sp. JEL0728]|nr:hypothetical protein HDV01_000458 [Terramyces sp. JEL0728]